MAVMKNGKLCCIAYYTLRYNAVVVRHLFGPPYKRGALWDPVDLFDIIIPRRSKGQAKLPRLEVELVLCKL